jgi:hypothetical protein
LVGQESSGSARINLLWSAGIAGGLLPIDKALMIQISLRKNTL